MHVMQELMHELMQVRTAKSSGKRALMQVMQVIFNLLKEEKNRRKEGTEGGSKWKV